MRGILVVVGSVQQSRAGVNVVVNVVVLVLHVEDGC